MAKKVDKDDIKEGYQVLRDIAKQSGQSRVLTPVARAFLIAIHSEHNGDSKEGLDEFFARFANVNPSELRDSSFSNDAAGLMTAVYATQDYFRSLEVAGRPQERRDLYQNVAHAFSGYYGLGEILMQEINSHRSATSFSSAVKKRFANSE